MKLSTFAFACCTFFLVGAPLHAAKAPNIILFLADDLGWGDLACFGNKLCKTPNLDAFAMQGAKFTQCYSAGAVCSPSRSALLTGRTPYRNGVFTWIPENREIHLLKSELALPLLLKQVGYTTCHVGKWHLNGHFNKPTQPQPNDHGYDHWLATQNNAGPSHAFPVNFVRNGQPVTMTDDHSAPFIVKEAIDWLGNKRDKDKPFFLAVWSHEPHYPIAAADRYKKMYEGIEDKVQLEYLADVTQMDDAFGKLMKSLDDMKLAENTLVFFTSDNGPEGDGIKSPGRGTTGGLRGRKRAVYEGGIRVPGIVRWPGHVNANITCDVPVIGSDFFAMACNVSGAKLPQDRTIDGGNLLDAVTKSEVKRAKPLYWHCDIAPGVMKIAMRQGDWKIIANEEMTKFELYNLKEDPSEKEMVNEKQQPKLLEMTMEIKKLTKEIEAEGPDWWKNYNKGGEKKANKKKDS